MDYVEAKTMADALRAAGVPEAKIEHFGFWSQHNPALDADGKWEVHVIWLNSRAGNRNLEIIREFAPDMAAEIAHRARRKATGRDKQAFARMAEANEQDRG